MQEYRAPLADMKFVLRELVDLELLAQLPGFSDMTPDVAEAILEEAAKFASGVLSPLNQGGFTEAQLAPLIASPNDILVFVHGAANSFSDAITRAAYNQAWLAAAALPYLRFRGYKAAYLYCLAQKVESPGTSA